MSSKINHGDSINFKKSNHDECIFNSEILEELNEDIFDKFLKLTLKTYDNKIYPIKHPNDSFVCPFCKTEYKRSRKATHEKCSKHLKSISKIKNSLQKYAFYSPDLIDYLTDVFQ